MADAGLRNAGVRFPPPLYYVAGLLAAWSLDRYVKALSFSHPGVPALATAGWALTVAGVCLVGWGMATFRRAHTAIIPNQPASRIVTSGPYRFTRNPMYTGLAIAYGGVALLMNSAWPLILLPLVIALLVRFVISREEAYLRHAFSTDYGAYSARVRRWL